VTEPGAVAVTATGQLSLTINLGIVRLDGGADQNGGAAHRER